MARPEKVAVVDEVRDGLSSSPATLLTEYRGLTVTQLAELRGQLRAAGARYVVVKNTLARLAARDAGYEALEDLLVGPTALTFCEDDPVGPAKALRRFAKDHPLLVVKGGVLEGRVVDAGTADRLADLETREELLAKLAGLLQASLSRTAAVLQAPITKMARLVAALEDAGLNPPGEAPADAAPAAAVAAPADEQPAAAAEEEPDADAPASDEAPATDDQAPEGAPDEPAAEEPSAEEPAADEPAPDEPAPDESPADLTPDDATDPT